MTQLKLGKYQHYKGAIVEVLYVALHSETLEEHVVYIEEENKQFGKNSVWVRPLKMFLENVVVDGKEVPRFKKIE
jgi:hypothetical protein